MSKYDQLFANMKTYILLIIISILQLGSSLLLVNSSEFDSNTLCPSKSSRRKRGIEYTRWQATADTTPQFIVKVLDEDITTSYPKKVFAVNIQPSTTSNEKIIVGGVIVPPGTVPDNIMAREMDYTRFMPPTSLEGTQIEGELHLSPIVRPINSVPQPIPKEKSFGSSFASTTPIIFKKQENILRNAQRDESPPAGPHFLPRTNDLLPRQNVPVTAVAFSPRTSRAPPNQLSAQRRLFYVQNPTRTTQAPSHADLKYPGRTQSFNDDLANFDEFIEEEVLTNNFTVTRTSKTDFNDLDRTISLDMEEITEDPFDTKSSRVTSKQNSKIDHEDLDVVYNMMFYEDDDNNKTRLALGDNEDYRNSDNIESYVDAEKASEKTPASHETHHNINGRKTAPLNNGTEMVSVIYDDDEGDEGERTSTQKGHVSKGMPVGGPIRPSTTKRKYGKITTKDKNKDMKPICTLLKLRNLSFNSPRTLPEIIAQLKHWAETSPVVKWLDITNGNLTTMENPVYMMKVEDLSSGQIYTAKETVLIVAGIQGRDHHAVAAAMYVLYELIDRGDMHVDLLTKYRFWIVPVFNPDGYEYSMTFPHRREWAKNLHQEWEICKGHSCMSCETHGLRCTLKTCYGVNLDRNFEYQWIPMEELRTEHPCGNLYAGPRQLSEPETRALTQLLHEQKTPIYAFIAFKEGDVLGVMYPYSHTRKKRAYDSVYRQLALKAASAANAISGRPYVGGQTSDFLPLYAGGIEDWVDGHLGIDNTYTIMMFRPSDSYTSKQLTERVVHEAYAAMSTLLLTKESRSPPSVALTSSLQNKCNPSNVLIIILTIPSMYLCLR